MKQITRGELLFVLLSAFLSIGLVNGHESTLHAYESAVVRSANLVSSAPCEISEAESCKIRIRLRDVDRAQSRMLEGHYEASLKTKLPIERPGWLATRIADGKINEMGANLFAHTSPIYIEISGRRIFDSDAARKLVGEMNQAVEIIPSKAIFSEPSRWKRIRQIYEDGMRRLQERLD